MGRPSQNIHSDIATALSGCPAAQARAAADLFLQEVPDLRPSSLSTLTGDGFPLICTFTTADTALRWTADLRPRGDRRLRRIATQDAFRRLTQHRTTLPQGGEARYGAWLGGRIATDGTKTYKFYQDPNAQTATVVGPIQSQSFAGFHPRLQMIGYGPSTDRREFYYRFDDSSPRLLKRLLETASLGARFKDTEAIIDANARKPIDATLPGGAMGASFAFDNDTAVPQLTLYFFARAFWGTDAAIRRNFITLLQSAGRDPLPYAAASAPLSARKKLRTFHDMAALSVTENGHAWGVGLRPISAQSNQIF